MFILKFLIFMIFFEFGSFISEDILIGEFTRCKDDCMIVKEVKFASNKLQ